LPSDRIAIRAVGPQAISDQAFGDVCTTFEYAGIVPRSEMAAQYAWADVLVLPTISEGSANVCYEALAAGLPVITTPHAGSVVRDGLEGFLVPIRSSEQLSEKILKLDQDTNLWQTMSENALARAQEFTWDRYANRLLAAVGRLFETQSQKPAEFAS
jgi:glycosyltransferase involved in cell wall biosynthesis